MTIMAAVVIGVKGKDHIREIKSRPTIIFEYFLREVDTSGEFVIGWSYILAVVSALASFASFVFFFIEYKSVTDETPTRPHPV
jgi:hypothetical protein